MKVKLAKQGYYGGDPDKVGKAPVTTVLNILCYETFEADYKLASKELNDGNK